MNACVSDMDRLTDRQLTTKKSLCVCTMWSEDDDLWLILSDVG